MATIRKRGSRWQVQVRRDGHPPISKSFLHKTDAHQWARQVEIEIDRTDLPSSAARLRNIRLEDLVIRFRDEVVPRKRSVLTETTILNAFLRQPIGKPTLAQLRPQVVAEYRDQRLAILKPSTVRREFGLLRRLLNVARSEWSIPLSSNPSASVAQPRCVDQRTRRVSTVEQARLRAAAGRLRNETLASVFEFAIETGMRRGEILSLRWEHVNLSARTAFLPMTKNGHSRMVPLTRSALNVLHAIEGARDGIVFAISSNAVRLAWERLCRRAKVDDLHFHDLRHEAISRFFEKGLSMPEVALISGHRDPRMLFRYTHLQAEELARWSVPVPVQDKKQAIRGGYGDASRHEQFGERQTRNGALSRARCLFQPAASGDGPGDGALDPGDRCASGGGWWQQAAVECGEAILQRGPNSGYRSAACPSRNAGRADRHLFGQQHLCEGQPLCVL